MSAGFTQTPVVALRVTGPYCINHLEHIMIWHQYGYWYMDIYDRDTETWIHDVDLPMAWQPVGFVR